MTDLLLGALIVVLLGTWTIIAVILLKPANSLRLAAWLVAWARGSECYRAMHKVAKRDSRQRRDEVLEQELARLGVQKVGETQEVGTR